ncbi:hypothetical protein [Bdellovibrio sp. NC01]|uniref:hypothetical protein n=1 Tax=Bdellovibrio sp. NC01 TaxID=2220073 RepID=UPI00115A56A0|nr:hypothetical protein [Bdellovibrio sp. NC01]QDK37195.1 hypothetical protein DOE51_06130 [Bdellovibrio sp. NC01]
MDLYTRRLIERRALQLTRICEDFLLHKEDQSDDVIVNGFKWGFLILRKPKRYLEEFKHGSLLIDPHLLQRAFLRHQDQIDGHEGMMEEEKLILEEFSEEASEWMAINPRTISLVPELVEPDRYTY